MVARRAGGYDGVSGTVKGIRLVSAAHAVSRGQALAPYRRIAPEPASMSTRYCRGKLVPACTFICSATSD